MSSKSVHEASPGQESADTRSVPFSLATRLTAWYAGSAFLLIAAATGFLYWALAANLDREDDDYLADKIHFLQSLLRDQPASLPMLREEVELEPAARQSGQIFVRILDASGQVVMETPRMDQVLPPACFPTGIEGRTEPIPGKEVTTNGKTYRLTAAPGLTDAPGNTIQIALDRTAEEELLTGYRRSLWLVLGAALVLCGAVGYQIAHRGLRPVAAITEAACRIRSTTLHERLGTRGLPLELQALATRFNEMLDRLQEAFERLARFSADIAHELRNPLNNLRGEAEVALAKPRSPEAYQEVLGSCLEECARLAHLVESLLFIARAESPQAPIQLETLDVAQELRAVRDFFEAAAAGAGVRFVVEAPADLKARLDSALLRQALGNLVTNALAHTPAGGTIRLEACRDKTAIRIQVSDTGSGIPEEHLAHVFDRFYRADRARTAGAGRVGLGLAIVRSIAHLHGGSAAIASTLGRGTRVTLVFPCENP
jgi:two-component system heavy metal sensor histidine kinase CusS